MRLPCSPRPSPAPRSRCRRCIRCSRSRHPPYGKNNRQRRSAMTRETVLSNARIVLEEEIRHGSVLTRDGLIADIGPGLSPAGHPLRTDLGGDYLLPGVVELHTDHLEYHLAPRPNVQWDPLPAVLASDAQLSTSGATTVFDAVRV